MPSVHPNTHVALFQLALGITPPWQVADITFSKEDGRLDIHLTYQRIARFPCACCKELLSIYDTVKRTWRHLNFFQYETYLHADVPRIQCPECKITKNVSVPWGRPNSGFTLLFEAFILELASAMALTTLGGIVNEHDTRLMRIVRYYVTQQARAAIDMSEVRTLGVDETSKAKGHDYITTFIDIPQSRVLFATPGKDSTTVNRFADDLNNHGGSAQHIEAVCADLSPAYQRGVSEHLPNAEMVFDRFHVMKLVNEALDAVRREEQKENPLLRGSRYAWLHNPETATDKQTERLQTLTKLNLKTVRAYQIRLALRDVYEIRDAKAAKEGLKRWYFWATHSRIEPVIKVAKTIKEHWNGVVKFFNHRIANGLAEGINSIIQTIKRRARGYQNTDNFITMIYLSCSKLNFDLPKLISLTHYK
jgi:transposase